MSLYDTIYSNGNGTQVGIVTPLIIGFFTVFIAQILSGFVRNYVSLINGKRVATATLHSEFNSDSMSKNRRAADLLLQRYGQVHVSDMEKYIQKNENIDAEKAGDRMIPLFVVMRFYQRISAMQNDNALRNNLVFDLFGMTFVWWYIIYFEDGFEEWTEAHFALRRLYSWMHYYAYSNYPIWKENSRGNSRFSSGSNSDRVTRFERWVKDAKKEKKKRLSSINQPDTDTIPSSFENNSRAGAKDEKVMNDTDAKRFEGYVADIVLLLKNEGLNQEQAIGRMANKVAERWRS